ncbi:hypothetical protein D3C76_1393780 [compost metagenome]
MNLSDWNGELITQPLHYRRCRLVTEYFCILAFGQIYIFIVSRQCHLAFGVNLIRKQNAAKQLLLLIQEQPQLSALLKLHVQIAKIACIRYFNDELAGSLLDIS